MSTSNAHPFATPAGTFPQGAHLLLQTRIRTLDGTLRDLFAKWYPALAVNDNEVPIPAAA